ncbi:hypothetical protein J6590_108188 [Homalodisca vitripennis]|nr:hypothetical protein J6590_108188 [Homalodisca vitripennis]
MTSLDLSQGFLQTQLSKESRKYVAFVFEGRNLQYKRLPYGLNVSTALFIKGLNKVLGHDLTEFVTTYVDDILITSNTYEEHLKHVEQVLSRLKEGGITVKLKKLQFLRKEINYVRYIISAEGIKMDKNKIEQIVNFKRTTYINIKELKRFIE